MRTLGDRLQQKATPQPLIAFALALFLARTDALGDIADHALPDFKGVVITLCRRRFVLDLRVEAEVFRLRHRRQVYDDSIAAHVYQSETRPVRGLS